MKAYYGFKVIGNIAYFLEQFKDFYHISDGTGNGRGFLGIEINSTEYVAKSIEFPKMLENYLMVAYLSENKKLIDKLQSYQNEEKEPIIIVQLERDSKIFKNWDDYELFLNSKNENIKKIKP